MTGVLLRLYPRAWRVRYGAELEELIVQSSAGRASWRIRANVVAGALRERLRSAGHSGDAPPHEQARGGALLALCAWVVFVVGGLSVQKFSEHWQAATPPGIPQFPALAYDAFDALLVAAAVGSALVLVGIALTLPALIRFLREGGWPLVRRRILVAVASTVVACAFVAGLAVWARGVTVAGRNGGDPGYVALAGVTLAAILVCLAAWAAAAVACARRIHLSLVMLVVEAVLAVGVTLSMATMTAAVLTWWVVFARAAQESFFEGSLPQLVVGTCLMVVATLAGSFGSVRAVRGVR